MKKVIFKIILFFLVCFFGIGCKHKINDYRNNYVGSWHFNWTVIDCPRTYYPPCDTSRGEYDGTIDYERRFKNDELLIVFSPSQSRRVQLSKQGIFTDCGAVGEITNANNLTYHWQISMSCGGGHSTGHILLKATKIK